MAMAFIPSIKLSETITTAQVGLWVEQLQDKRLALVCKAPETSIRALSRGAACTFLLSTIHADSHVILCLGLRIDDEPENPFKVLIANCSPEDARLLPEILQSGAVTLHCINELNHPVLSASCSLETKSATSAAAAVRSSNHWLLTRASAKAIRPTELAKMLELALDRFQSHIHRSQDDPVSEHVTMTTAIPLTLDIWKPTEIFEISPTTTGGPFLIDDKEEGPKLEKQIQLVVDSVYPRSSYVSPDVQDGKILRELADVLGFDSNIICVIQAKALAVLGVSPSQASTRRRANVEKDIKKALKQLAGALNKIRDGSPIFKRGETTQIEIPNRDSSPAHAIVVLSEMYAYVDWKAVAGLTAKASNNEVHRALFHVLDIRELATLATNCKDSVTFSNRLMQRWVTVEEKSTGYIRVKIPVERAPS